MDYFTSVAYRLDQQRGADLVRVTELRRRQAERASVQAPAEAPARHGHLAAAWARLRTIAHPGHPVAH